MKDLVAFYETREQAEQVKKELLNAGYDRDDVSIYDRAGGHEAGLWEEIKAAFGFSNEEDQRLYAEAARRGSVAVALSLDDDDAPSADQALSIMLRHHPIDLDKKAAEWAGGQAEHRDESATEKLHSTTTPPPAVAESQARSTEEGETVIPVMEEELQVGKRAVQSGGVRIHSRVTQKPVEEQVNLRQERVTVQRRPVDRPAGEAQHPFEEKDFEVRETVEEVVVSKRPKIVEEVVVNKDVQERTETVRDTVRRTDVDVERTGDEAQGPAVDAFCSELAHDRRYKGRDWKSIEPDARRGFEERYPGNKWDQFKDAIHRGYEKVRQKV